MHRCRAWRGDAPALKESTADRPPVQNVDAESRSDLHSSVAELGTPRFSAPPKTPLCHRPLA